VLHVWTHGNTLHHLFCDVFFRCPLFFPRYSYFAPGSITVLTTIRISIHWSTGKSTGNHQISWIFPMIFPWNLNMEDHIWIISRSFSKWRIYEGNSAHKLPIDQNAQRRAPNMAAATCWKSSGGMTSELRRERLRVLRCIGCDIYIYAKYMWMIAYVKKHRL
jgi:hypothetical protein